MMIERYRKGEALVAEPQYVAQGTAHSGSEGCPPCARWTPPGRAPYDAVGAPQLLPDLDLDAAVGAGGELEDDGVLAVVAKEAKQRRESIEEFGKAGRQDLVEKEQAELAILTPYLPEQLSRDEIVRIAREVIQETGANDMKDMGKVMSAIMGRLRGRADGREVNAVVREVLSGS